MKKELKITPMELYFLGVQMKAKYIDYAYIAALPDIGKRYAFHEQNTLERLEKKRIIEEEFNGNVEVEDDVKKLLEPVFFGEVESKVQIPEVYNFHISRERIVQSVWNSAVIVFSESSDEDIRELIKGKDIKIQCANVKRGRRDEEFTVSEMDKECVREQAVKIILGEW